MKTIVYNILTAIAVMVCVIILSIAVTSKVEVSDDMAKEAKTESTSITTTVITTLSDIKNSTITSTNPSTITSTNNTTVSTSVTTPITTCVTEVSTIPVTEAPPDTEPAPQEEIQVQIEEEKYEDKIEEQPEQIEPVVQEEYIVYKESTHYVHKNTCRWSNSDCVRIDNTEGIECRKCTECNPDIEIINEYQEPVPETPEPVVLEVNKDNLTYVKSFSRGTYYAYGGERYGGSSRYLYDCSYGDGNGVKGSIASSYLYDNYGYKFNNNGRTLVYLEVSSKYGTDLSSMNGFYYLDDCDAGNYNVIDFFYLYDSNCPFYGEGVVNVECWI